MTFDEWKAAQNAQAAQTPQKTGPVSFDTWKAAQQQGLGDVFGDLQPGQQFQQGPAPEAPTTMGQAIQGGAEAGGQMLAGIVGGLPGMVYGTGKGLTQAILDGSYGTPEASAAVEQAAMQGMEAGTKFFTGEMSPTGQRYAQNIATAAAPLMALGPAGVPLAAPEMALAGGLARQAAPQAMAAANVASGAVGEGVQAARQRLQSVMAPTPDGAATGQSVGAAGVSPAVMRQSAAQELDIPITKGQATREFKQQRFEQETAKDPELGGDLRDFSARQHEAVRTRFDQWVDETGSLDVSSRDAGLTIDAALRAKAARDKNEIRVAYTNARKAGEMLEPVTTKQIADVLNESVSAESTAPVLVAARKELIRLGGAVEGDGGQLIQKDMTLENVEQLRKFISKTTGADPTNIKFASDLKRAIDSSTDGAGGDLYKKARGLYTRYANQYENHAVISDLLKNKMGTADRRVALEDVTSRVLYRGSLDDMRHARRVLQTGGDLGKQAWKEIQGAALRDIVEAATKNVARDVNGNPMISPAALDKAVKRLDSDGKLHFLFGKKGGEKIHAINDLAKVMFTSPPGAVNTSNTASVLLAAMDIMLSASSGWPLPIASGLRIATKQVKDRKTRARIKEALNYDAGAAN